MVDEREIDWQPMEAAPTDGRKIIIGQIAKWVPYMDPQKMGRTGRWQVRNDYGKWSNCDRANDYFITGYKPDDQSALLAERERVAALVPLARLGLVLTECWPHGDVDGGELQDAMERCGLIAKSLEPYDADKHVSIADAEEGDEFFLYTDAFLAGWSVLTAALGDARACRAAQMGEG